MLVVAAALVSDGRVLAGRRPAGGWEFPGGKVEPGERLPDALVRECREELGIRVEPVRELGAAAEGDLDLRLWLTELTDAVPTSSTDHAELRWVTPAQLEELDWLPLDRDLIFLIRPLLA